MNLKRMTFMLAVVFIIWLFPAAALAGDDPLLLESSSIKDAAADVPVDVVIELSFSNNVVNQSVKENNASCLKLMLNGKETAVDIIMADDQVQPDLKRIIKVKPKESLQEGQKYELVIGSGLTAKNGNKIGRDTVISFATKGAAPVAIIIIGVCVLLAAVLVFFIIKRKHDSKKEN